MRQIDPAGSVFAKPDRVAIRKEATKDDGWATHAMHRLSSLSKKATLVVGIALVGVSAMAAQPATTDRAEQVRESYASAMQNAQETQAWQSVRPGMVLDSRIDGVSLSGVRSVHQIAGTSVADLSTHKTAMLFDTVDGILKHLGKQTGLDGSASSLSIPKAYFKPASSLTSSPA